MRQADIPKVSIVTALYNHRRFLRRRVESILNQTMQDFEWIIVDDCSTDGSYEYAQELICHDPRVTLLQNDRNRHIAYTNQRGIDLARGTYLYRTDSDDYCTPQLLAKLTGVFDQNPNLALVHCRGFYMDEDDGYWGGFPRKQNYYQDGFTVFQRNLIRYEMKSSTIMYRRSFAQEVGGFTAMPLLCAHDWYLSLRVSLLGDVAYIDEPLTFQRSHGDNYSSSLARQLDVRQQEIESFGLIDNVLSHVPPAHAGEIDDLRKAAYAKMAQAHMKVVKRAREQGMGAEAQLLEDMVRKYVEDLTPYQQTDVAGNRVKAQINTLAGMFLKRLTYRRIRSLST